MRSRVLALAGALLTAWVVAPAVFALPVKTTVSTEEQARRFFEQGYEEQQDGLYEEAIEAYQQSLKHDRRQPQAMSNLGFCYKQIGRYRKAITFYLGAIRLNPKLAEAHEYLGETYVALGKIDGAEREYAILLELDPEEAEELRRKIDDALEATRDEE